MSAFRPLPPRPSLEYEHKEAKALLRQLRAGDPDSLARARGRHPTIDTSGSTRIRLSDAQLIIAREYGFTSWPRLVRYFGEVDRQQHAIRPLQTHRRDFYESSVRGLIDAHRNRRVWIGITLASYVPRFYGMRDQDVFASTVTEDDARLAIARQAGFPSWEVLLERTAAGMQHRRNDWEVDPMNQVREAMTAANLDALRSVVEAHPELLHPTTDDIATGRTLIRTALDCEWQRGAAAMRPIIEWLATQGFDCQLELNRRLCGHMYMKPDEVRFLLERGADPNWVAPNGIPVLEHAILRYWNGEAIDVLAARATPRKALWIAAALGDVDGVAAFLDRNGKPTAAARQLRPDFDAAGPRGSMPTHPDPTDEQLLMEAFVVAVTNGRLAVVEYMASRGFPVDSLVWGIPVINIAVGNGWVPVVECLIRCGANVDLRGWHPSQTAREIAREIYENNSENSDRRRIAQLCGLDPAAILAERDARPMKPPGVAENLQQALELAGDDAFRLGQPDIRPDNLLFGMLRGGGLSLSFLRRAGGDLDRFHADVRDRVQFATDCVDRPKLPLTSDAQAVMRAAIDVATERRRDSVGTLHLLYVLTRDRSGPTAQLLGNYALNAEKLNAELERAL